MNNLSRNFEIFIKNITLDSELVKICEDRCEEVCRFLHAQLYSSEYDGSTRLVVGPFAKKTQISPEISAVFKAGGDVRSVLSRGMM